MCPLQILFFHNFIIKKKGYENVKNWKITWYGGNPYFFAFFFRLVGHMVCEVGLVCLNPL